jgi:hypothetical protein
MNMSVAGRQVREIRNEPRVDRYVGGVTAEGVAGQQRPVRSTSDFMARGGLQNTANQAINKIQQRKQERDLKDAYEEYLAMGERGADVIYNDALAKYGEKAKKFGLEATAYFPPKYGFYDESGKFLSNKYAESMATGSFKLNGDISKKEEEENVRGRNLAASQAIPGAEDQADAFARAIEGAGGDELNSSVQRQAMAHQRAADRENQDYLEKKEDARNALKSVELKLKQSMVNLKKSGQESGNHFKSLKAQSDAIENYTDLLNSYSEYSLGADAGKGPSGKKLRVKPDDFDATMKNMWGAIKQSEDVLKNAGNLVATDRVIQNAARQVESQHPAVAPDVKSRFGAFKQNYKTR